MNELLSKIDLNDFIIPIVTAIMGAAVTFYIFFKGNNKEIARERLEKVYFPIFKLLSHYFFKFDKKDKNFIRMINEVEKIINDNEFLAGNTLYYLFEIFKKQQDNDSYNEFCKHVINEQNKLLNKIGLPIISPFYRANHKMFTKFGVIAFFTKCFLRYFVIPLVFFSFICLFFYKLLIR